MTSHYGGSKFKKKKKKKKENETLCLRCMRKKYKCLIIWMLSIAAVSQFLYLLLEKIDNSILETMLQQLMQNNST